MIVKILDLKTALGQYYFWIRYTAAFFERFIVKTDRYQSPFLSQSLGKEKLYCVSTAQLRCTEPHTCIQRKQSYR
jgi:hypothetical protein